MILPYDLDRSQQWILPKTARKDAKEFRVMFSKISAQPCSSFVFEVLRPDCALINTRNRTINRRTCGIALRRCRKLGGGSQAGGWGRGGLFFWSHGHRRRRWRKRKSNFCAGNTKRSSASRKKKSRMAHIKMIGGFSSLNRYSPPVAMPKPTATPWPPWPTPPTT